MSKEDTSWFFTEEWQIKEKEATRDFDQGDFDVINSVNELLTLFDEKMNNRGL